MDISLIIPCYNEAPHLRQSVLDLCEILDATAYDYEIVFVDDVSKDETRQVIEEICARTPRCRYIFHEQNRGRGGAFKTGFAATTGKVTGFLDIDLEVAAHYVLPLVNLVLHDGVDVATGDRHYLLSQTHALVRTAVSWVYRGVVRASVAPGVKDSETGCKFFNRETCSKLVFESESDGWFWDSEVMARAVLAGLTIRELPVLFLRRWDKQSTVKLGNDIQKYLFEIHKFRGKVGLSISGKSPIYWSGAGYDLVMAALYGEKLANIYAAAAAHVPDGASVVDLCCGTAQLYRRHLAARGCDYLGLDFNAQFVFGNRKHGIPSRFFNVLKDEIPAADYVTMVSSLYHFRANADELLSRMLKAARKGVIISEPVENWSSKPSVLGKAAAWLSNPGVGDYADRYDVSSFEALAKAHGAKIISAEGGRNALAVFEK
ncbi:MAG: glycosyltransferase [Myxococcales bacterium]|nr:MAG: glycosyltransferase [Myxococcales bacterium]